MRVPVFPPSFQMVVSLHLSSGLCPHRCLPPRLTLTLTLTLPLLPRPPLPVAPPLRRPRDVVIRLRDLRERVADLADAAVTLLQDGAEVTQRVRGRPPVTPTSRQVLRGEAVPPLDFLEGRGHVFGPGDRLEGGVSLVVGSRGVAVMVGGRGKVRGAVEPVVVVAVGPGAVVVPVGEVVVVVEVGLVVVGEDVLRLEGVVGVHPLLCENEE